MRPGRKKEGREAEANRWRDLRAMWKRRWIAAFVCEESWTWRSTATAVADCLFSAEGTLHDGTNGIARGVAEVQDTVDLLGDRQVDVFFAGEIEQRRGGADALGDHVHPSENFREGTSLAEFETYTAIAA